MSRAEEKHVWAGTGRNYLNVVRNKKSLNNEQIENDLRASLNETIGTLDALEEKRAQVAIEARAKLSLLITALDKKTAHLEQQSQSRRASRETRDNETQTFRIEMVRWVREKREEDLNTPDNRGVGPEGLILPNELPGLSSAAGDLPARRKLTNGTGAIVGRPEEASNKRSMGGLECHDIQTVKTLEVQSEPTCQLKLQKVRQVDKNIIPPAQPLPERVCEPPSRRCSEQLLEKSSGSHKRPCEGQPNALSKRQATVTGKGFHQPDRFPIMRAPEQNRTPAQISGGSQSISQNTMYGPLYGNTSHLPEGPASEVQSGSSFCSACLSAQSSQMCCSTTRDRPRINSINSATAPARWPRRDYNVHPTYPTAQNLSTRYGPIYGSCCGPSSYVNSTQYQIASKMPSMCPQRSNNTIFPMDSDRREQFPDYPATAPAQRLESVIPGHSPTPNFQMFGPRTHFWLDPDSYETEGRDMRSGEPTATNSQQPSQNTSRVDLFRNTTVSDANSIMRGVAPSGSSKTFERRRLEAQDRERRLKKVAIRAIQMADAHVGHLKEES
ncbi:hypothetical protein FCOIX_12319 [Fusarium coicis]|nr:hypothetical protein FCOIX_12319 [Fusarium coicis]